MSKISKSAKSLERDQFNGKIKQGRGTKLQF